MSIYVMALLQQIDLILENINAIDDNEAAAIEKLVFDRLETRKHNRSCAHERLFLDEKHYDAYSKNLGELINKISDKSIIIYVEHIQEYILFSDSEKYRLYTNNTVDDNSYVRYQIVDVNESHKMILLCHGNIDIHILQKIQQAIREKFGTESKVAYNGIYQSQQITTELQVRNLQECRDRHVELCEYINDNRIAMYISAPISTRDESGYKYIKPVLIHTEESRNDRDKFLGDLVTYKKQDTSIICTIFDERTERQKWSHRWIDMNLPKHREKTGIYYKNRYLSACALAKVQSISVQELSKYIESLDYKRVRTNKGMYWTKPEYKDVVKDNAISIDNCKPIDKSTREFIYFIVEVPYNGMVKIGRTGDLQKRLMSLQTGNSRKLSILHFIERNVAEKYEITLHEHFKYRRANGEWFRFTQLELDHVISGTILP